MLTTPTINMTATGANTRALIKSKGLKVTDVQTILGFNTPQAIFKWMRGDAMLEICREPEFTTVPIEEVGTDLPAKYPTVEALLERAGGNYPNGGKKEGIVIRPTEPVFSSNIGAELSMKVVSNRYLLKNDD